MLRLSVALLALLACSTGVPAGAYTGAYKCVVLDKVDLQDDGTLGEPILAYALGKDFVVDKETGRMSGALVNHYGPGEQPQVLSEGSKESSYKAITYFGGARVELLYIQEWAESQRKPFFFVSGFSGKSIFSGLCDYY